MGNTGDETILGPQLTGAGSECLSWLNPLGGNFALGRQDVHVWRARLDVSASLIEGCRSVLTSAEVSQAERFQARLPRHRYITARGVLRKILSRYLPVTAESLRFQYNEHGKPYLAFPGGAQAVNFNLSHSSGWALFAVAHQERRIGIDLEKIRTIVFADRIAAEFFSPEDCAALAMMPEPLKSQSFFRSWTKMEAYAKALGTGLTAAAGGGKITLQGKILDQERESLEKSAWSIRCWRPVPEYAAALAVEGDDWQLRCWEWRE